MTLNAADKKFLDGMVPHHREAISMARTVLAEGSDERVQHLAENVIAAQSAEIKKMISWYPEADSDGNSDMSNLIREAFSEIGRGYA